MKLTKKLEFVGLAALLAACCFLSSRGAEKAHGQGPSLLSKINDLDKRLTIEKSRNDKLEKQLELLEQRPKAAPIGSIVAWPRDDIPEGWKVCDGSVLDRKKFSELYAVIGLSYSGGAKTDETEFRLPDYRGYFLRACVDPVGLEAADYEKYKAALGVFLKKKAEAKVKIGKEAETLLEELKESFTASEARAIMDGIKRDPGVFERSGTALGPWIGSTQDSEVKAHDHELNILITPRAGAGGGNFYHVVPKKDRDRVLRSEQSTGSESRPKNVYVHWIIKTK